MAELPIAIFERVLRQAGAKRVSEGAATEFADLISEISSKLAADAIKFAEHANRKTVTAADIKMIKKLGTKI